MHDRDLVSLDNERLGVMSDEQARAVLIRVLDSFESSELSNYDHLMLFGIRLARSGHSELDLAAVDWAAANPSLVRLDIVCTLLSGSWKHTLPGARITAAALEGLIRVHGIVRPVGAEEYQYLLALSEISAGNTFRSVVRGILEKALKMELPNSEMDRILKGVIRESLRE
jgi:hypothetical protein